ncbi:MAG: hypothetical protein KME26_05910 [Oscillatoria princeps RMCB-10]|nr:hypothetical protein [Oscillatoria princeps RMCB-10]
MTVEIVAVRTSHSTGAGCRMLYCLDRREATPALFAGFCPPRAGNNRAEPPFFRLSRRTLVNAGVG